MLNECHTTTQRWAYVVSCIINNAAYGLIATRGEAKQDRQFAYNVALRCILVTIVAVEKQ